MELLHDRFFDEVRELLDDERTLDRVLVLREAQLLVDDELDREGAADRLLGGGGDRLVVRVRVERVAVVEEGVESLERRPNVVERDLLGVERASARLDVVLELLGA